uniref:Uncharacterized protein n=1 Tax=Thalassia hemprichii TaxID=55496 RepID=A0A4Y1KCF4_9LILI|nr:hypothetical protein [Thalassia hemprichii]ATP74912.1 hypothetical protein [Thalassia hemprichii]
MLKLWNEENTYKKKYILLFWIHILPFHPYGMVEEPILVFVLFQSKGILSLMYPQFNRNRSISHFNSMYFLFVFFEPNLEYRNDPYSVLFFFFRFLFLLESNLRGATLGSEFHSIRILLLSFFFLGQSN